MGDPERIQHLEKTLNYLIAALYSRPLGKHEVDKLLGMLPLSQELEQFKERRKDAQEEITQKAS